ncbi:hypothetical protein ACFWIJ_40325 [Streptomyces sp. NPDC127079]|uniref:hypothetical protein n=1 Tax=Streptomyces sp. NPDC127079 TaxID=3347132 RepID=UPI003664B153
MPILCALADPKVGGRGVLAEMLDIDAGVAAEHNGILLILRQAVHGPGLRNAAG